MSKISLFLLGLTTGLSMAELVVDGRGRLEKPVGDRLKALAALAAIAAIISYVITS
ncbi:hypothetical protein ACFRFU_38280 [Streptomyces sp. NPDC056704]|uniref:hypothetical protein n=1 Tax=Streptomyces sp. NPDC056704 TaxID=3345917 RepID=UPI0036884035